MEAPKVAHPVRVARGGRAGPARPIRVVAGRSGPEPSEDRSAIQRRENRGATRRAVRLSILYAAGIAVVYAFLVALAQNQPTGGSSGTTGWILVVGLLALGVAVLGVLVALGVAPRSVEVGERSTVVVGRFGRRYRFPGRSELRTKVLRRFPAGFLTPVALESIELVNGSTRRSFLLEEGLVERGEPARDEPV